MTTERQWEKLAAQLAGALHDLAIVPIPWPRGQDGSELDRAEEILDVYRAACPTPFFIPRKDRDAARLILDDFQAWIEDDSMEEYSIELTTEQHEHYTRVAAFLFASHTIPEPTLDALVIHALKRFEESFVDCLDPELRELMMGKKHWQW